MRQIKMIVFFWIQNILPWIAVEIKCILFLYYINKIRYKINKIKNAINLFLDASK